MPVYVIQSGETDRVKIGWADDVAARCRYLQTSHHEPLHVIRIVHGARTIERWLHRHFAAQHIRGEWFQFHPEMLVVEPPDMGEPELRRRRPIALVSWASEACTRERLCPDCAAIAQSGHPMASTPWLAASFNRSA